MRILLIEDNDLKKEKVKAFIIESFLDASVETASSYNTGMTLALDNSYDLIILDMSIPTYEKTESNRGGRFRVFGGREIAQRLKKMSKLPPFLVLTGYKDFKNDNEKTTFEQLSETMSKIDSNFLGMIHYESASSKWKSEAVAAIRKCERD